MKPPSLQKNTSTIKDNQQRITSRLGKAPAVTPTFLAQQGPQDRVFSLARDAITKPYQPGHRHDAYVVREQHEDTNQQAHTGPNHFHASVLSYFGEPVRPGAHPVDSFRSVRFSFASVLPCPITSTMSPSVTDVAMYLLLLLHTLCPEGLIRV